MKGKKDNFQMFSRLWQDAIDRDDWDSAILSAFAAYMYFNVRKMHTLKKGALGLVVAALKLQESKEHKLNDKQCSFCGRAESQTRLGAGPNPFICENCVSRFGEIFNRTTE